MLNFYQITHARILVLFSCAKILFLVSLLLVAVKDRFLLTFQILIFIYSSLKNITIACNQNSIYGSKQKNLMFRNRNNIVVP